MIAIVVGFAFEYDRELTSMDGYLLHSTFCFLVGFGSTFWINSYFFIIPKTADLKEWCSTMDVRVLEA